MLRVSLLVASLGVTHSAPLHIVSLGVTPCHYSSPSVRWLLTLCPCAVPLVNPPPLPPGPWADVTRIPDPLPAATTPP